MKKALLFIVTLCLALLFGAAPTNAVEASRPGAAETSEPTATTKTSRPAAELLASPKCTSSSPGPIRYQLCVRYTCDIDSCAHRASIHLTNTTTSSRTVAYILEWRVDNSDWREDISGSQRLGPGEGVTIISPNTHEVPCGVTVHWRLTVNAGSSSQIIVSAFLPCP